MPIVNGKWMREYEIRGSLSSLDDDDDGVETPTRVLAESLASLMGRVKMWTGRNDWLEIRAPSGEVKRWEAENGSSKITRDDFAKGHA